MGNFKKIPVILALLITVICQTFESTQGGSLQHHKVRHKHNQMHFSDQRVNEIREAFHNYKNVVQKPWVSYDDAVKIKPLRHHRRNEKSLDEELTSAADPNGETSIASPQDQMVRYKRVFSSTAATTQKTTTTKFSDNYDEEYNDDEDSRKLNDESTKVQVSCVVSQLIRIWPLWNFTNLRQAWRQLSIVKLIAIDSW